MEKDPPGWVLSKGKNTEYSENNYFIGFGVSDSKGAFKEKRANAEKMAKDIILDSIKKNINQELIDSWLKSEGYIKEKMNDELYKILVDNIHNSINYDFEGIVIDSVYYDKEHEVFYILAFLNRKQVSLELKKDITRHNFEAEMSYKNAIKYFETGNYFMALQNLFNAEEKKYKSILFGLQYMAIRTDDEKAVGLTKMSFYLKDLEKTIYSTIDGLTIELDSQSKLDFSEKIKNLPIELYIYFRDSNNLKLPIKDATIISEFIAGKGDILPDFSSSVKGIYKFKIKSIEKDPNNHAVILFALDTKRLYKLFTNPLTKYWLSRIDDKKIDFDVKF
jgi:hypothetical protein